MNMDIVMIVVEVTDIILMIVFTMEQMADIPRIREEKEQMSLPVSVGLFI